MIEWMKDAAKEENKNNPVWLEGVLIVAVMVMIFVLLSLMPAAIDFELNRWEVSDVKGPYND